MEKLLVVEHFHNVVPLIKLAIVLRLANNHIFGSCHCTSCNMDTCSGSCIQSGAMDFLCLSYDYFALLDLISFPELFSDSGS